MQRGELGKVSAAETGVPSDLLGVFYYSVIHYVHCLTTYPSFLCYPPLHLACPSCSHVDRENLSIGIRTDGNGMYPKDELTGTPFTFYIGIIIRIHLDLHVLYAY